MLVEMMSLAKPGSMDCGSIAQFTVMGRGRGRPGALVVATASRDEQEGGADQHQVQPPLVSGRDRSGRWPVSDSYRTGWLVRVCPAITGRPPR
jgi:hypothetical protein